MTISVTFLLVVGTIYCLAHRGRDWPAVVIFTSLGVFAADTFLGDILTGLWDGIVNAIGSI